LFNWLLDALDQQLMDSSSQAISNAVYACALAGHKEGIAQLLDQVSDHSQLMKRATAQDWSNLLWAAAELGVHHQHLFADGAKALAAMSPAETLPQHLRTSLHAFALAGHWDTHVLQLLVSITQELSKTSYFAYTMRAFARLAPLAHKAAMSKTEVKMYSAAVTALAREVRRRRADSLTAEERKRLREAQQYIAQMAQ
jgi:hypothetical protein